MLPDGKTPIAINTSGTVLGLDFLWKDGTMVDLATLGGIASFPRAINDSDWVVGNYFAPPNLAGRPFLWIDGALFDIPNLGGFESGAYGVNNDGAIVGRSSTPPGAPGDTHAFLYRDGVTIDLGTFRDGYYSAAAAINDFGHIVGEASTQFGETHAFRTAPYQPIDPDIDDLGTLGGTYSTATAINQAGHTVGYSYTTGDLEQYAFFHTGGEMVPLPPLAGSYSVARSINNADQVVGGTSINGDAYHAFIWKDGQMEDLNELIPRDSGWELSEADGINDRGQIIGFGTDPAGNYAGFLLTPSLGGITISEPSQDAYYLDKGNYTKASIPLKAHLESGSGTIKWTFILHSRVGSIARDFSSPGSPVPTQYSQPDTQISLFLQSIGGDLDIKAEYTDNQGVTQVDSKTIHVLGLPSARTGTQGTYIPFNTVAYGGAFWTDLERAICWLESNQSFVQFQNGLPYVNASDDVGLMQINGPSWLANSLTERWSVGWDWTANIRKGLAILYRDAKPAATTWRNQHPYADSKYLWDDVIYRYHVGSGRDLYTGVVNGTPVRIDPHDIVDDPHERDVVTGGLAYVDLVRTFEASRPWR
jgi:probable HAF family extracellular repeat protein